MKNEVVSQAESAPGQVGDALGARHAGSCVLLQTGSSAELAGACARKGFLVGREGGGSEPFMMSEKHWVRRSVLSYKTLESARRCLLECERRHGQA